MLFDSFLLAPLRGVFWVVEQIHDQVQRERENEETLRRRLVHLRLRYEMGEVDEESYLETEADLLARLRERRLARLAEMGGEPGGAADPRG